MRFEVANSAGNARDEPCVCCQIKLFASAMFSSEMEESCRY